MSLVFLKLGGSLITDKDKTDTANLPALETISQQVAVALRDDPDLQLVLGHGSGSFGHHAAHHYQTQMGVHTPEEWLGFVHVWQRARALNQIVVESLAAAGVPVVVFSPSSFLTTQNQRIGQWDTSSIHTALTQRLVPVLHGDVVFDRKIGGTIVSTEELFIALANTLTPDRILLAGIEPGVWQDYSKKNEVIPWIDPSQNHAAGNNAMRSASIDVTGGMGSKVEGMLRLVRDFPGIRVSIFSGVESGNIYRSLMGESLGTCIENRKGKVIDV